MDSSSTKLEYHVDMFNLQSQAIFLSLFKVQDGRTALILYSTVFHPQGGGQPSDTGFIEFAGSPLLSFQGSNPESRMDIEKGQEFHLFVDQSRRKIYSRLHSAGHLLGLGIVPQAELQVKQKELVAEANDLISKLGKVYAAILPYDEASMLCGGNLHDYIPKGSSPRILRLGENPGCPCGGTHVSDISDIISMKGGKM